MLGPTTRFWFGGDTGYSEVFKQNGEKYGPCDMMAIPIGAYEPNWFMKYDHVHPGEAVEIHKDIRSIQHWGENSNCFDIPIFTEEFLDHNKARELELKQTGEFEEQNGIHLP